MVLDTLHFGLDIGQVSDHTAIVIARPESRDGKIHYIIHGQFRLELGLSFQQIEDEIISVWNHKAIPPGYEKHLWCEAVGIGKPVAEKLRESIHSVHAVFVTGGDRVEKLDVWQKEFSIPKAQLIANLQFLFGYKRIHLTPGRDSEELVKELMNFDLKVTDAQNIQYGAFKVGTHDDLVTALGLACLAGAPKQPPMAFRIARTEPGYYQSDPHSIEEIFKYYK